MWLIKLPKTYNSKFVFHKLMCVIWFKFRPYFQPSSSTVHWEILQLFSEHVNIKISFRALQVTFILKSRFSSNFSLNKPKLLEFIYYNIYCWHNCQYCWLQLHIVMFIYTSTLHHYVTPHYKHTTVHGNVLLWLNLYRGKSWIMKLIIRKLVKYLRKCE